MLIKGKVEHFSRRRISGWLALVGEDSKKPLLELLLDGQVLMVEAADKYRPDLAEAGWANGECQFEFELDPPLTEAEMKRVKLRIGGSDLCLEMPQEDEPPAKKGRANRKDIFHDSPVKGRKVFIVGSPRSGTSVLLLGIKEIFNLPGRGESHVIPAIARVIYELRQYYERFRHADENLLINELPMAEFERTLFRQIREFYRDVFGADGWVDKTPSDEAVHSATLIWRIFPDAKVIVTKRNGIEVVSSYRRKFNSTVEDAARNWVNVMRGIEKLTAIHPDVLIVDQYEFTNSASAVSERIAAYLEQPDRAASLAQFLQSSREDKLSSHDWTRQPTLADVDWTEIEKAQFRDICGEAMDRFGYMSG